jgi:hypothetical protein
LNEQTFDKTWHNLDRLLLDAGSSSHPANAHPHSPATPKRTTIQTSLRVALKGRPAKLVRLCKSVAGSMPFQGLACLEMALTRHIQELTQANSGLQKHCRSALTWASTTACCRFIVICACHVLSGSSHDFPRYRCFCLALTNLHDLGVPASTFSRISWDWPT